MDTKSSFIYIYFFVASTIVAGEGVLHDPTLQTSLQPLAFSVPQNLNQTHFSEFKIHGINGSTRRFYYGFIGLNSSSSSGCQWLLISILRLKASHKKWLMKIVHTLLTGLIHCLARRSGSMRRPDLNLCLKQAQSTIMSVCCNFYDIHCTVIQK